MHEFYAFIDYFLPLLGVENFYIEKNEKNLTTLKLFLRETVLNIEDNPLPVQFNSIDYNQFITAGDIVLEEKILTIFGKDHRLSANISLENFKELTSLANNTNTPISIILDDILDSYLLKKNVKQGGSNDEYEKSHFNKID